MVTKSLCTLLSAVLITGAIFAQQEIFSDGFDTGNFTSWSCATNCAMECSIDTGFSLTATDQSSANWVQVFDLSVDASGNVFLTVAGFDSCDGSQIIVATLCDSSIRNHCLGLQDFDILFSVSGSDPDLNSDFPTLYVTKSFTTGKPIVEVIP